MLGLELLIYRMTTLYADYESFNIDPSNCKLFITLTCSRLFGISAHSFETLAATAIIKLLNTFGNAVILFLIYCSPCGLSFLLDRFRILSIFCALRSNWVSSPPAIHYSEPSGRRLDGVMRKDGLCHAKNQSSIGRRQSPSP